MKLSKRMERHPCGKGWVKEVAQLEEDIKKIEINTDAYADENAALKRGLQNLVADYEEIGGETFYDDSYKEAKALLADTQEKK